MSEFMVQYVDEFLEIFGFLDKFDDPFIRSSDMSAFIGDRTHGIIRSYGVRLFACLEQCSVSVIRSDALSHHIDEIFRPARHFDPSRIQTGESDGVSQDISPESGIVGDHEHIVLIFFYMLQRQDFRILFAVFFHRNEFIEDAMIGEQAHIIALVGILDRKESL